MFSNCPPANIFDAKHSRLARIGPNGYKISTSTYAQLVRPLRMMKARSVCCSTAWNAKACISSTPLTPTPPNVNLKQLYTIVWKTCSLSKEWNILNATSFAPESNKNPNQLTNMSQPKTANQPPRPFKVCHLWLQLKRVWRILKHSITPSNSSSKNHTLPIIIIIIIIIKTSNHHHSNQLLSLFILCHLQLQCRLVLHIHQLHCTCATASTTFLQFPYPHSPQTMSLLPISLRQFRHLSILSVTFIDNSLLHHL